MSQINNLLSELEMFQSYVDSNYKEQSKSPVTSGDLAEFGKQVYYVLDSFLKYMSSELNNS